MKDELLKQLKTNAVFADLSEQELKLLSPLIKRVDFNKGDIVFDVNKLPEFFYLIESGSFTLHLPNNEFKLISEGQLIGEIGVINGDFRSGIVRAAEPSKVISIAGVQLFDAEIIPSDLSLKILRSLSKHITNYLRTREQISTKEIIERGENDTVEFKSTLRWNLYSQKKDKAIEKAVLKTLIAFMNSNGGLLLVGVADDGEILGLENDRFQNHDKLLLHLTNIIKERIGPLHLKDLHFSIEKIEDKEILRVDCNPASSPAYFLGDSADQFFVRSGPSTTDLRLSKVYDYITERFK